MKTEETSHVFFFDDANQRYYIVGLSDFLDPRPDEEDTPKEIAAIMGKPLYSISGRVTELKEMGVVRPTKDVRAGSRAVELTLEWRLAAESLPEKQSQPAEPANQPKVERDALKAEISRLYDSGDTWGAVALAHRHKINCVMELPDVVI